MCTVKGRKFAEGARQLFSAKYTLPYKFLIKFMFESISDGRSMEVKVVAGDGLFFQASIQELVFTHTRFLQDWHHLFSSGLPDLFGKGTYGVIETELGQMIRTHTK